LRAWSRSPLARGASLAWGVSDHLAGTQSRLLLRQRLGRVQEVGVGSALADVALLSLAA
jgi:hypothetical protein